MLFALVALFLTDIGWMFLINGQHITYRKKAPLSGFWIILLNNVNGWLLAAKSSNYQENLFGT